MKGKDRQAEEYAELIFNSIGNGLITIDRDFRVVMVNRAFLEMAGAREESEVVGRHCYEVSHGRQTPCSDDGVDCPAARTFSSGRKAEGVHTHVTLQGGEFDVEVSAFPVRDGSGKVVEVLEVVRDLTVRRRVEKMLRESEKKFRVLFEAANDGILLHDRSGKILEVNPKAVEMLGYEKWEILGLRITDLHPPEALEKAEDAFREIVRLGFVSTGIDFRRKDGTVFPAEISSSLLEIEGREVIQGIVRDVTERQEAEKAVRDYAGKLRRSNDLKELFTDILSHDLLNPASIIHNVSTALAAREHPRDAEEFSMIQRSARRIMKLIDDASIYARVEGADSLKKEGLDLAVLVKSGVEGLRPRLEEKGMTCTFTGPTRAPATLNPVVEEIFENLLANAIKYSPEGSEVAVVLAREGEAWKVTVADKGPGIPDEYKESIFERFKRRDKKGVRGTGLGLAIARRIADLHDGEVRVRDNPGGGSLFTVRLPMEG